MNYRSTSINRTEIELSERHIKLCREAIKGKCHDPQCPALDEVKKAHPLELLLAMHQIKRYHVGRGKRIVCNGCSVQQVSGSIHDFPHRGDCPVARYEELTSD